MEVQANEKSAKLHILTDELNNTEDQAMLDAAAYLSRAFLKHHGIKPGREKAKSNP